MLPYLTSSFEGVVLHQLPKKFGLIRARMIHEAQSKISPKTTFLINFLPCSYPLELAPLLAIITPPAMIIIKEVTRIKDNARLINAFIRTGKAQPIVTLMLSLPFLFVFPNSMHLPTNGTFVFNIIHPLALHPHNSLDLFSVVRQLMNAFLHFSNAFSFSPEQASSTVCICC